MAEEKKTYFTKSAVSDEVRKQHGLEAAGRDMSRHEYRAETLLQFLKEKNILQPDICILDGGCGFGHLGGYFADKGFTVVLLEFDINYLSIANEKYQKAHALYCDLQEPLIPIKCESFDIIFLRHVIEHADKPEIIIKNAMSILKPGGHLVLDTPNVLNPIAGDTRKKILSVLRLLDAPQVKKVFSWWGLKKLFAPYDVRITSVKTEKSLKGMLAAQLFLLRVSHKILVKKNS